MPYGVKARKEVEMPATLDLSGDIQEKELCFILVTEETRLALEKFSDESGESFDFVIKEAVAALRRERARKKEEKKLHLGEWSRNINV